MPIRRVETGWKAGRSRVVHATVEDAARYARRRQARILAHDLALRPPSRRHDAAPLKRGQRFSPRLERMHAELLQSRWKVIFDLVMKHAAPAIREQAAQIAAMKAGRKADAARLDASTLSVYDVIQIIRATVGGMLEADAPGLRLIGDEIDEDATDSVDREVSRLFTIPLSSQVPSPDVKAWVLANVDLSHALIDHGLYALERTADEVIRAVAAGKPTLDLAHEYQERFGYTWRKASFLARDQTANLASRIAQERMTSLGVEEYQWSTSGDSRVRQEHADLDGHIFRFDDPPVADLMGRRGNPGEVWQCLPGDTDVSLCHLARVGYRRWFDGELTELVTETGETLRATPNHPVLTRRGWVAAHLVEVGEDVFRVRQDLIDRSESDVQHGVSTIQQVFEALALAGVGERASGGPVDFHGDGADDDIDLVRVNWGLPVEWDALGREQARELLLSLPDAPPAAGGDVAEPLRALLPAPDRLVRSTAQALALILRGGSHADEHGRAAPPPADPPAAKLIGDRFALDSVAFRERLHALAPDVPLDHLDPRIVPGVVRRAMGADEPEPMSAEALCHVVAVATEDRRDFAEVLPLQIEPVRVVSIGSRVFAGHVYNLETATGWYVANGIITHNCRCVALPVLRAGAEERANLLAEAEARQEQELWWMQASPTVQGEIENRSQFSDWNAVRIANIKAGIRSSVGLPT